MARHDQKDIVNKVSLYIKDNHLISRGDVVIVAVSGGADSICLLNILLFLKDKTSFSIKACHYNHGTRGAESDKDEEFVRQYCRKRGLDLSVGHKLDKHPITNEEDARRYRYNFFNQIFLEQGREGAKIALAHNLNDLTETFLMRLLRGSGLKGLSSILPQRDYFIRPLLHISKKEIINYLDTIGSEYRLDASNNDEKFLRNKIRHSLIPELKKINPKVDNAISSVATQIAEDYAYIERSAEILFGRVVKKVKSGYRINLQDWQKIDSSLKPHLLHIAYRKIIIDNDLSRKQLQKMIQIIDDNNGDKKLPLPHSLRFEFKNGKINIYSNKLN